MKVGGRGDHHRSGRGSEGLVKPRKTPPDGVVRGEAGAHPFVDLAERDGGPPGLEKAAKVAFTDRAASHNQDVVPHRGSSSLGVGRGLNSSITSLIRQTYWW